MSLFEDLVEELKGENLIEETVIETNRAEQSFQKVSKTSETDSQPVENSLKAASPIDSFSVPAEVQSQPQNEFTAEVSNSAVSFSHENSAINAPTEDFSTTENGAPLIDPTSFAEAKSFPPNSQDLSAIDEKTSVSNEAEPEKELEFFRRRAVEEVASLKIVEHIISGIEREHMKIAPRNYDDISVSMALHDFLQIQDSVENAEHSLAEFRLMQETEMWYSALTQRDLQVSVGNLRVYCENARPGLSVQALIALARFYRNAPFTNLIRSKFELVTTRLFSRENQNHFRELPLDKNELVQHIADLYADWSSIPLYAPDDDPEISASVLRFGDFCREAESSQTLDELIEKDFFNRFRDYKDALGENFFSPLLTAAAIETNVSVGNRYIELVAQEKAQTAPHILQEKYRDWLDQSVSEATSKSLQLISLLNGKQTEDSEDGSPQQATAALQQDEKDTKISVKERREKSGSPREIQTSKSRFTTSLQVNKYLLAVALILIAALGGLYFWVEMSPGSVEVSQSVEKVDLNNSVLKEFFRAARINEGTYYAVAEPTWKDLSKEAKESILKKTLEEGASKNYSRVHILDAEGKTVGYASPEKGVEITESN